LVYYSRHVQTFMKTAAAYLSLLVLPFAFGQNTPQQESSTEQVRYCRADETVFADCIRPAQATYSPEPEYPAKEHRTGHQGTVILRALIDADGVPHDVSVTRSLRPAFDESAVKAVGNWRFSPATKYGKPVPVQISVQVEFNALSDK
jgi:periplasmic protein TonB